MSTESTWISFWSLSGRGQVRASPRPPHKAACLAPRCAGLRALELLLQLLSPASQPRSTSSPHPRDPLRPPTDTLQTPYRHKLGSIMMITSLVAQRRGYRLNLIYTKNAVARPANGLSRYPRLVAYSKTTRMPQIMAHRMTNVLLMCC